MEVATYLSMLKDCLVVFKESHSLSYFSPNMSLFFIFSKGKIPEHIPRYLRMGLYL